MGMFTYAPQRERYAFFLADGSTASSLNGSSPISKKGNNSNFTYHGRSYGMGSSVGLVDMELTIHQHIKAYRYFETGYNSKFTYVDVVNQTIKVGPHTTQGVENIDPSSSIAGSARDAFAGLSLISINSFISVLGNMIHDNLFNVKQQKTKETDEELLLRGVVESLQALADQYFFSLSAAQLMITNDTISEPVISKIQAIYLSKDSFIYAVTAINCLVVLILLYEATRTGLWSGLLTFNFADVKSVIVGTSQGGSQIGQIVRGEYKNQGKVWSGEAIDRVAGSIPVQIVQRTSTLAVVAAV
ncbi:hypothetical protein BP6252_11322 [Coleophoma cylindrospora]|uniref:Uncharacterized protein n=1 Tax=Coleophoma cylindrospora TaxID=1849047 RepID=A0A3D8QPR6_9HELO|nr:hypothetical protein BP6252_11322 [Coleophoma cylindrospora]